MAGEALGAIEVGSVGAGILAADGMLKKSGVTLVLARPLCPGKYLAIVRGSVSEVEEGISVGAALAGDRLVDQLVLPNPHPGVLAGLLQVSPVTAVRALGIIETYSASSCLEAADLASKRAEIDVVEVRLSIMMAGKNYLTLTGDESAVREAVENAAAAVRKKGLLLASVVIPHPHEELVQSLL